MNLSKFLSCVLLIISSNSIAQNLTYSSITIDPELKENANAVIRSHDILIELHSYSSISIKDKRVITILNKNGFEQLSPYLYYDPAIRVKSISAVVYNDFGKEIKKFKRRDFDDYSTSGSDLFSDNRVLALDYTPISYPFTFVFETETQSNSTAFIPRWYPVEGYFISTEKSSYKIMNLQNIDLSVKEFNFGSENIENKSDANNVDFSANNLKAYKWEYMSPAFNKIAPLVMVAAKKFKLVNVDGHAENWNDFGKWNYDNLLKGRSEITDRTRKEITNLLHGIEDPIEKAKLIYQYVQDRTRYISIQLGVGGWQPMLASKVDEVSYGDCKALTNYTQALMLSQGITAYYSVVYGGEKLKDIEEEFVGMQGNHVILNIPNDGDPIWLECTSQKVPFGHIANFTDDRDVLVVTPEGGIIEHTKVYSSQESYLKTMANIDINQNGGISAEIVSRSGGVQYDDRLKKIIDKDVKDRDAHYKKYWSYINGLSIDKFEIQNDKDSIVITERLNVESPTYGAAVGENLLFTPNVFNRLINAPPRYSERKLPFVIERGFYDEDIYNLNIPEGFNVDSSMLNVEISSEFGVYKVTSEKLSENQISYKRSLEIFKGNYTKEDYKAYRSFMRKISKTDKSSIVLNRIN